MRLVCGGVGWGSVFAIGTLVPSVRRGTMRVGDLLTISDI